MRTAVVTLVSGRHDHLRSQLQTLQESTRPPDEHCVVAMGDDGIAGVVAEYPGPARVLSMPASATLPLAQARNLGAREAIECGADLLVFLDVDCVAHPQLLARYREAARTRGHRDDLLCGPVTYLDRTVSTAVRRSAYRGALPVHPHPARPHPPDGVILAGDRYELFWSLSFAVRSSTWTRIGGFCEDYTGYGAEDTDFAQTAEAAGVPLAWVGGAHAFHLHHPVSDPPVEHLDDILRNAAVFRDRWGWWPMQGWLAAFESRGLVRFEARADEWVRGAAAGFESDSSG